MYRLLRAKEDYKQTILRNQLTSLILFESVKSVRSRAKELEAYANHFFNRIKKADLNAKKLAHRTLFDKNAVVKCFEEIMPRYKQEETTFVRRLNLAPRAGDNSEMALVTLLKTLKVEPSTKKSKDDESSKATSQTPKQYEAVPKTAKAEKESK